MVDEVLKDARANGERLSLGIADDEARADQAWGRPRRPTRATGRPLSLASKFRFPETETAPSRDWFERGTLLLGKTENFVLFGPFGGQVGEASNPHAMRKPPVDSRLDEVRCKESKRDRHIHFSDAAAFSLGDACRSCCCISNQFLEPTAATGDRCNQCCASFRTDGTSMFRRNAFRQKDLAAPDRYRLPRHTQRAINSLLTVGSRCLGKLDDQLF
jgi:hypothetical protein